MGGSYNGSTVVSSDAYGRNPDFKKRTSGQNINLSLCGGGVVQW